MENYRKKQIAIIISLIAIILAGVSATYAWFTIDRITDTDMVSAKTNEDAVDLLISAGSGAAFTNSHEAPITQVNNSDNSELMPESTADLKEFMYASISTPERLSLARDSRGQYYYHGRVYIKANATAEHAGKKMTIYLDGSEESGGDILQAVNDQMLGASRVGLLIGGKNPVILNFDNAKAEKVALYRSGAIEYTRDPSNYVKDYLIKISDGKATRPEKALMTIELNKEYPIDIYYYMEGFDDDCTDAIAKNDVTLHLALFGVLE